MRALGQVAYPDKQALGAKCFNNEMVLVQSFLKLKKVLATWEAQRKDDLQRLAHGKGKGQKMLKEMVSLSITLKKAMTKCQNFNNLLGDDLDDDDEICKHSFANVVTQWPEALEDAVKVQIHEWVEEYTAIESAATDGFEGYHLAEKPTSWKAKIMRETKWDAVRKISASSLATISGNEVVKLIGSLESQDRDQAWILTGKWETDFLENLVD